MPIVGWFFPTKILKNSANSLSKRNSKAGGKVFHTDTYSFLYLGVSHHRISVGAACIITFPRAEQKVEGS